MKKRISFFFLCYFSTLVAIAQIFRLTELEDVAYINTTKYYIDSTKSQTIKSIAEKFRHNQYKSTQQFDEILGIGKFHFWVSFDIHNDATNAKEVVFEVAMPRVQSFSLYAMRSNKIHYEGTCNGLGTPLSAKPLKSYSHALKIKVPTQSTQRFYVLLKKFPGSVRNTILLHTPVHFEQKQQDSNTRLSFYLAFVIITFLSSLSIWFYTRQSTYIVFTALIIVKTALNLQFGEYLHLLLGLGFAKLSTSVILLLILSFQYLFFKYYFTEKVPRVIYGLVILVPLIDFIGGEYFQQIHHYYLLLYSILLGASFYFIYEVLRKIPHYKIIHLPLVVVQLLTFIILTAFLLSNQFHFFNNFLNKHAFQLLFYNSFIELVVYCFYLSNGVLQIHQSSRAKSKVINRLQGDLIHIQEAERRKIAIDLHDDLGSTLSVLKEQIFKETTDPQTQRLIHKAIDDLRSISHNLLPVDFEAFGLVASLEKYIRQLNDIGLKITFIVFGEQHTFPNLIALNLYRILVEILHNFKKHSPSKEATVQLIYHAEFLHVAVECSDVVEKKDDIGNGIGQKSIISRLEYLHARVLEKGESTNGYSYIFEIQYDQNLDS